MACACADKVFHMKNKKVVRYYLKYSHDEMVIDRNLIDINWYSKVCDELVMNRIIHCLVIISLSK